MKSYLNLLNKVLNEGIPSTDRTRTGTLSIFGSKLEFDLSKGFPLLTTKKVHWKSVVHELLWFISGSTNVQDLQKYGVTIWDEWAEEDGSLGPIYGSQWRNWNGEGIDQLKGLITSLKADPRSRRHIVSAWNPSQIPDMALPPCHMFYQAYLNQGKLSLQIYQRSVDVFLGLPFNIASYALLTHMLAKEIGAEPDKLIWIGGDTHLYMNHIEQAKEQLSRRPRALPILEIEGGSFFSHKFSDFRLSGYTPDPAIKAPIAV